MPKGVYRHLKKSEGAINGSWFKGESKIKIGCSTCHNSFECYESEERSGFCSLKCYHLYLKTIVGKLHKNWKGGFARNRAIRRGAEGRHTPLEWEDLKKKYGYMCLCCKRIEPEIKLTKDHIIPLIKGGTDYISNIQPLCLKCNDSKNVKIIYYIKQ